MSLTAPRELGRRRRGSGFQASDGRDISGLTPAGTGGSEAIWIWWRSWTVTLSRLNAGRCAGISMSFPFRRKSSSTPKPNGSTCRPGDRDSQGCCGIRPFGSSAAAGDFTSQTRESHARVRHPRHSARFLLPSVLRRLGRFILFLGVLLNMFGVQRVGFVGIQTEVDGRA